MCVCVCRHEAREGEKMEKANVSVELKLPLTQVSCYHSMVLVFNDLHLLAVKKKYLKHLIKACIMSHSETSSSTVLDWD